MTLRFTRQKSIDSPLSAPHLSEAKILDRDIKSNSFSYRPSRISIDLDAIEFNFTEISKLVHPSKVAVAVKANAYGHGIVEVAKKLQELDVEMLCVATAEEALCLREHDIESPILLLSEPPQNAIAACYLNDITFTVCRKETIELISSIATRERKAHLHLKVETGMNRIGVDHQIAVGLAEKINSDDHLVFDGVFTHFSSADELANPATALQLEKFERVLDEIGKTMPMPKYCHAANSAASLRIPDSHFSMVRVGISIYGIYPDPRASNILELHPVLSLTTEVAFLKKIRAGESVSYGAQFTSKKETQIATLPIGYGDGVPRNYGLSGGSVLIGGSRFPIVGRVTMDQTMVDVGDLETKVGDKVTMIGVDGSACITATEWGDTTGTIAYEVLCRLNGRLPRFYD